MKNVICIFFIVFIYVQQIGAKDIVTNKQCLSKGDSYIYSGGECIEFYEASGDTEGALNIVVHGTWKAGTNILGRYAAFADDLAIQTEITTVAVALPGYSNSSTNRFTALSHKGVKYLVSQKKYIEFAVKLIENLKKRYNAKIVNYIGHSAGAALGATIVGYKPKLINNLICAGGYYDIHKKSKDKALLSAVDFVDKIDKNSKILLIYGSKDKISKPIVSKEFYKIAKDKGVNIKLVEVKNGVHLDLDMSDTSVENIIDLLR